MEGNTEMGELGLLYSEISQNCIPDRNLLNLYNYLKKMKNTPRQEISQFHHSQLMDIGEIAIKILNRDQSDYDKDYLQAINVFLCFINIKGYTFFIAKLRPQFFKNIAPKLKQVFQFWTLSKDTDKSASAQAILILFFRALIQIASEKNSICNLIYKKKVLDVLSAFDSPNDENVLTLFSKMVFQAIKASKQHKKCFALKMLKLVRYDKFPLKIIPKCLQFAMSSIASSEIGIQEKFDITKKLKEVLRNNFSKQNDFLNLNFIVFFISAFFKDSKQLCFTFVQLAQYCMLIKGHPQEMLIKFSILNAIAVQIMNAHDENTGSIDNIELLTESPPGLDILNKIVSKISSVGLIKIAQSSLLGRLLNVAKDTKISKLQRTLATKALALMTQRMYEANKSMYNYLYGALKVHQQLLLVGALPQLQNIALTRFSQSSEFSFL